ncbi:putative secreted protein [Pseudomonas fluorescens]|jgi:outer membrane murein-binding lipoprotein Lpp|uniref:Putative secreted protein n=1 Tax=Pseudomonas fluorescens TaxID=294 RepID=A0A379IGL4_PSEFL|nr:hypothetical protein [Pseudomonas fluorescens]SUD31423.1 putative secreted protein [Pseudomonas fluorescens]
MTGLQASPGYSARTRWLKIAAAFGLLLISAVTIVNSVGLSRLTELAQVSAQDSQVKSLAARMADLEREVDAASRQPKPISQVEFDVARQTLEERLTHVEHTPNNADQASELQALQMRLGEIEARLEKAKQPVSPAPVVRRRGADTAQPKALVPPFRVVGVERRGGERFLSIASRSSAALADIRLLRQGDTESGWQLESIDAHAAAFRVNGQTRRVAVP